MQTISSQAKLHRYPIDHPSRISKDWNNVFAFTDAMQPRIPIRPYEQKSRTQTIPNPVTTTPQLQLPARASISTNRTHFHLRAFGRGIQRASSFPPAKQDLPSANVWQSQIQASALS